ncbi:MAG: peptidase M19 [Gammaproteobacteria bacterium]|nr:peptidase M19 [Gammaproteobacteria bacterium]
MGRRSGRTGLLTVGIAVVVAACADGQAPKAATEGVNTPPSSRYDLANRCFTMKAGGAYTVREGSGFVANGASADGAERFYLKAAGLGRYLFYTADKMLMTASGSAVGAVATPADGSDWTVDGENGRYTAAALNQFLAANSSGGLVLGAEAATLTFEPASGCSEYPEMPVGIVGPTFKGPAAGKPVIGFAEVHAHMAMGSDMSDGSGDRGPSSGGVMYGHAVNRFGVPAALGNCEVMHGPDGMLSPEAIILDQDPAGAQHDTVGWPDFIDWPKHDSMLHQQMYYRWVERAYRAGLRTMVVHGTNIEALCNVAKSTVGDPDADCTDMGVGTKQVAYLYDIQNYVDAQEGGPGKGWFRVVKDPADARATIAAGKLAVVPGLEFSNLFRCNVSYGPGDHLLPPNEAGTAACTKEDIDREIEEAWTLGVRAVFPFHDVDSALGGTGIFDSIALNLVGFYGTNGFWRTYDCEDGGEGDKFLYNAGSYMYSGDFPEGWGGDPLTGALVGATQGLLPMYPSGKRQCNARDVTDLGKYAIRKIMEKGFTLDIDHAEIRSKQYMLDEGAKLTPNYPMISGHGGHGGISKAQAEQMIRQGGIIYPALENGKNMSDFLKNRLKPIWQASGTSRPLAMGYGADANGLRNLPGPRGAGGPPLQYPFTMFAGEGWGSQFRSAGIRPVQVEMLSIPGGKSWNMDEEGMSHYGLVADIVEEMRLEGGEDALTPFYRSAETYLQLWEQTLAASAALRQQGQ